MGSFIVQKVQSTLTVQRGAPAILRVTTKTINTVTVKPTGTRGPRGERGERGESIRGERGEPGVGVKGEKGDPGLSIKGDRGEVGPQGIQGISGRDGTISGVNIDGGNAASRFGGTIRIDGGRA